MLYQLALEETQTWPVISTSLTDSKEPSRIRKLSGSEASLENIGDPQFEQNALCIPSLCSNSFI